ncbi:MAG: response regulator [Candidatus Omnitrophota bacterium]|jgi:CheY-like chemotaxis protein
MNEKIHVLLVDDEPDFVESMSLWLEAKGYSVSVAPNGEKAIQIVKEQAPHIAFLDIKMPGMDGIETLRRIRQINQKLPVIMITAYADEEKLVKSQELNISGFFAKDEDVKVLQDTIELTLRTYKKIWKKK